MKINEVLVKPILTEKATNLVKNKVYSFGVNRHANKHKIKTIVEKLYQVKVGDVKILVRKGKQRKVGKKMKAKKLADKKIAYVKIIEGKIDLFPQT